VGKLIATEFVTLDGVAQSPGRPDEDPSGGFTHGGWQMGFHDEGAGAVLVGEAQRMNALLLGRHTYDIFASYWPAASPDIPFTPLLNAVPKYVVSNTLAEPLSWQGSQLLTGSLEERVRELTARYEEVHVIGSLHLLQSLLRLGLVDRLNLWMYPLLLGGGKRVFADGVAPASLRLANSVTYPSGTLHLTYDIAG
jgi:dihydrofolate reductase